MVFHCSVDDLSSERSALADTLTWTRPLRPSSRQADGNLQFTVNRQATTILSCLPSPDASIAARSACPCLCDTHGRKEAADESTEKLAASLWYLLCLPPIRRRVLDSVSAFDAAKLDNLQLCVLTTTEKKRYLKPLRDLVWDVPAVESLSREGMKLTLLGDSAYALEQRLHATERYLNSHGHGRLAIYLLGTFPTSAPTVTTLDPLINFSTTGNSSPVRSYGDKYQLKRIRALTDTNAERVFVMSFSAPMRATASPIKGSWYKVDDVPDHTVDLWVYVPSFRDRLREEVRLTPLDMLRIVRASPLPVAPPVTLGRTPIATYVKKRLRSVAFDALVRTLGPISTLSQLFAVCTGRHHLKKYSLTAAGLHSAEATPLAQLLGEESSARRLLPHFGLSAFDVGSGLRAAVGPTQAPNIRLFLDIANYSTLGWGITIA
jgi:hypothetical protein